MDSLRLDKWLWAARFFRTRALAKQALEKGHIRVAGLRAKASREIQVGMQLEIRQGDEVRLVQVLALSEQRGPASQAVQLYREAPESLQKREHQRALKRAERAGWTPPPKRPDRDQRRQLSGLKRRGPD